MYEDMGECLGRKTLFSKNQIDVDTDEVFEHIKGLAVVVLGRQGNGGAPLLCLKEDLSCWRGLRGKNMVTETAGPLVTLCLAFFLGNGSLLL